MLPTSPFVLTIMGATGDLTKRKLLPALYHLSKIGQLPEQYQVIAFARRPYTDQAYIQEVRADVEKHYRHPLDDSSWQTFAQHLHYHQAEFHDLAGYQSLQKHIESLAQQHPQACANKLFYLAVNPSFLQQIFTNLQQSGLSQDQGQDGQWSRIIIEKPFGTNLETAQALNHQLSQMFTEEQIYRIDHYLGKETVQNILAFRFANGLFEPTWCKDYIDNVQITVAEELGVENRGEYYDSAGALRDVAQNHLLQLLSLIAMDEPTDLSADAIRDAKVAALQSIVVPADIHPTTIRGQYAAHEQMLGYTQEARVDPHSGTETYVAMKLMLNRPKWQGVPFYVRTGKRLETRVTEVNIEFKKLPADLFGKAEHQVVSNVLTLRIQPNEGISLRMSVKKPGLKMELEPVRMEFCYRSHFADQPDAYERLLLDAVAGDQTLFLRNDEVKASWTYMTKVLEDWQKHQVPVHHYPAGSWGPVEADQLIQADGRQWLSHQIATCPVR